MPNLQFLGEGALYSQDYQDVYYKESGIEESTHVFLMGIDFDHSVKEHYQDFKNQGNAVDEFVYRIAETGFGTGLNFILAVSRWRELEIPGRIEFYSVEKHPLSPMQMRLIQDQRPHLPLSYSEWGDSYEAQMSDKNVSTLVIEEHDFRLQVEITEGTYGLQRWNLSGVRKDDFFFNAWFLDGFDPGKNDDLWTSELFAEMRQLSQEGSRYSTFTTSGKVKRLLIKNGFSWRRREGILGKQHNMSGEYHGRVLSEHAWKESLQQALLLSIQKGSVDEVNQLVKEGAVWDSMQWIYHAALKGILHQCFQDLDTLHACFDREQCIVFRDERRAESILHAAVRSQKLLEVKFILNLYSAQERNELRDGQGRHALFLSSHMRSIELCEILLKAELDPFQEDNYYKSVKDYLMKESPLFTLFQ